MKACFERDQALSDAEKYKKDSDGFHYRNKELQLENKTILHNVSEAAIVQLNEDNASLKEKLLKADLENETLRTKIAALKKKEDDNILKQVNVLQNQINDMKINNKEKEQKEEEIKKELLEKLEKRSEERMEEEMKKLENAGSGEQKGGQISDLEKKIEQMDFAMKENKEEKEKFLNEKSLENEELKRKIKKLEEELKSTKKTESKQFLDELSKKDEQIDWLQKRVEQMEKTKQLDDNTKKMKEECIKVLEKDVASEKCEREKKTLMIEVLEKQIKVLQFQ